MAAIWYFAGAALVVFGVAFLCWPVAVIVAGGFALGVAYLLSTAPKQPEVGEQ